MRKEGITSPLNAYTLPVQNGMGSPSFNIKTWALRIGTYDKWNPIPTIRCLECVGEDYIKQLQSSD